MSSGRDILHGTLLQLFLRAQSEEDSDQDAAIAAYEKLVNEAVTALGRPCKGHASLAGTDTQLHASPQPPVKAPQRLA